MTISFIVAGEAGVGMITGLVKHIIVGVIQRNLALYKLLKGKEDTLGHSRVEMRVFYIVG